MNPGGSPGRSIAGDPMKKKRDRSFALGVSAGRLALISGVAACFAASTVFTTCDCQQRARPAAVRAAVAAAPARRTVEIESLTVDYLPNNATTRLSDMGYSTPRRGSWMRILIQFTTYPDWVDDVRFDCYVLLRETNRRTMLAGSVTCVNVQAGRRHLASLFIHPNLLERYGRRVEAVAVECHYQNSPVTDYSIPRTNRKWWQEYTGLSDTMVNWFYTPFLRDGAQRYEQIKIGRQRF